jgi:hypothetical protein
MGRYSTTKRQLLDKYPFMRHVRRGDYTIISYETGYDTAHVWRVLNGAANNPDGTIVLCARRLMGKRKK